MDIKQFFEKKLNIAATVLLGLSILLLIIGSFVPVLIGASVLLFGITCIISVPVAYGVYKVTDNSKAMENVELTPEQAKKMNKANRSRKWNFYLAMALLVIGAITLIYSGIVLYL